MLECIRSRQCAADLFYRNVVIGWCKLSLSINHFACQYQICRFQKVWSFQRHVTWSITVQNATSVIAYNTSVRVFPWLPIQHHCCNEISCCTSDTQIIKDSLSHVQTPRLWHIQPPTIGHQICNETFMLLLCIFWLTHTCDSNVCATDPIHMHSHRQCHQAQEATNSQDWPMLWHTTILTPVSNVLNKSMRVGLI